jgi:Mn2+/Fe2+ NRAMP family transporter
MSTGLATMIRLAMQLAQGQVADVRSRLLRSLGVLCVILVMIVVALAMAAAALAIALSDRIGLVPALLSIAAVATIVALVLVLTLRSRVDRPAASNVDLLGLAARELPRVDPLTLVIAALAAGLLLGRRRR